MVKRRRALLRSHQWRPRTFVMEIARLIGIPFALRAYRFLRSAGIFSSQYRLPSPGIRRDLRELAGTSRDGADCDFIGVACPAIRRVGRGPLKCLSTMAKKAKKDENGLSEVEAPGG